MERISLDEVRHVAGLARVELSQEELSVLQGELSALLEHVEQIRRLDTSDVEPMAHPLPLRNVLRDDVRHECLARDVVLAAAPASEGGRFLVPRILGEP